MYYSAVEVALLEVFGGVGVRGSERQDRGLFWSASSLCWPLMCHMQNQGVMDVINPHLVGNVKESDGVSLTYCVSV